MAGGRNKKPRRGSNKAEQWQLFLGLLLGFVVTAVIGVYTHEFGHYLVSRLLGYSAAIHWSYTENLSDIHNPVHNFMITAGGPLLPAVMGTLGCLALWSMPGPSGGTTRLGLKRWTIVFIALFWSELAAGLFLGLPNIGSGLRSHDDLSRLSMTLHLPQITLSLLGTMVALPVCAFVVFKFIPKPSRTPFFASGALAAILVALLFFSPAHALSPRLDPASLYRKYPKLSKLPLGGTLRGFQRNSLSTFRYEFVFEGSDAGKIEARTSGALLALGFKKDLNHKALFHWRPSSGGPKSLLPDPCGWENLQQWTSKDKSFQYWIAYVAERPYGPGKECGLKQTLKGSWVGLFVAVHELK